MRLLADENVPALLVESLRGLGHDVLWARTTCAGADDPHLLARASDESRVLVTFDKGFGELAFQRGLPRTSGVVLLRMPMVPPIEKSIQAIVAALQSRDDWAGAFAVVEPGRIRMRPMPVA